MNENIKRILLILLLGAAFLFEKIYAFPKELLFYVAELTAFALGITVYLAAGIRILKILKIKYDNIEKYPYAFALSTVFISTFWFAIGALPFAVYKFYFVYIFVFLTALLTLNEIKEIISDIRKAAGYIMKKKYDFYTGLAAFIAGVIFLYVFISCLVPPLFYDTLTYHLAVPQQYVAAGRIVDLQGNIYSYFPGLVQMNYLIFMQLGGDIAVNVFQIFFYFMSIVIIYKFSAAVKGDISYTVLLAASFPLFVLNALRCGVDLPLAFFILLALYFMHKQQWTAADQKKENVQGRSIFLGLILGAIITSKYTGAVALVFVAAYYGYLFYKKSIKSGEIAAIILIPFLVLLPYALRNYIFTGNPLYPFATGFFATSQQLRNEAVAYVGQVHGFGLSHDVVNFLLAPYDMTFNPVIFGGDVISPVLLITIALLFTIKTKNINFLLIFCGFYYTVWFFTGEVLRFILGPLMLMVIVAGYVVKKTDSRLKHLLFGLIIFVQIRASVYFVEKYMQPFGVFVAKRAEYVAHTVSYFNAAEFINAKTKPENAVLFLGEARSYYCERRVYTNTVFNRMPVLSDFNRENYDSAVNELKLKKIKYIMVNFEELERLKTGGFNDIYAMVYSQKFKNFIDNYFIKLYTDGKCDVYELK